MRPRTRYTLLAVAALLCALAAALYLRQKAPPEVARLLPESDAIVYLDVAPLRSAMRLDHSPVTRSPGYQQFVDATGFVAERDLDRIAFALHRMADPTGPNGRVAFSEVAEGRFDTERLSRYLASIATAQETYADRTIYLVPSENRTLRVAILGYDTVAASNAPTPEQIHSILDRSRAAASPFSGSALLSARYPDVPAFSTAWAVGRIGLPLQSDTGTDRISLMGLELPLPVDTAFVASLRLTGKLALHPAQVRLQVEEIAASEADAQKTADTLSGLLSLYRAIQTAQQPVPRTASDRAMRELVDSVQIAGRHDRAVVTAAVPVAVLRSLEPPRP